jgi:hypothetical protein
VRRIALRAGALACLVVGVFLILLATDVLRWSSALHASDVHYRANASAAGLWQIDALVPGDPGRSLLGIDDDLALRKAVRSLELSKLGSHAEYKPQLIVQRADAEARLQTLASSGGGNRTQRSRAAELLGVLQLASPTSNPQQRSSFLLKAVANLQKAIQLDPSNDEAKYNLEVALRATHGVQTVQGSPTPNVTTGRPGSRGAAAGGPGGGY